jgi:hypothetical protein
MHLHELARPFADRVGSAEHDTAWLSYCISAGAAPWLAWNVREDAWYGPAELALLQAEIDKAPAGVNGPALLIHIAGKLARIRRLSPQECAKLPSSGSTHVQASRFSLRYELAPESDWAAGSSPGEIDPALLPGIHIRVFPRAGLGFRWVTFDGNGRHVSRSPDDVLRNLGLPWSRADGLVLRIEVPLDALRTSGALFAVPTIFDSLPYSPKHPVGPDWRARPASEHHADEPWGHTRDMQTDGPALPEVIVDIKDAGTMDAMCLGPPTQDWSTRPYLSGGSGPR